MKILLLDRNEDLIDFIDVVEQKSTEIINADNVFEFESYYEGFEKKQRILFKVFNNEWKEFIIEGIEETHDSDGAISRHCYCESSFYETIGDYISDKRPQNVTATSALQEALESSRWEVGVVENLGLSSTNFYRCSVKYAVQQKILPAWNAEMSLTIKVSGNKIVSRKVNLHKKLGSDFGKRFEYSKDINYIKRKVNEDDIVTALYGFGKGEHIEETGGFGRRIDFSDINNGKAYVENNEARLIYGRNSSQGKKHIFSTIEFDDIEDKYELLKVTKEELEKLSKPRVSYSAKVEDLRSFGFEHEGVSLGDTVTVIDKDLGLRLKARIVKYVKYFDDIKSDEIELSNFIETSNNLFLDAYEKINRFREKEAIWDKTSKKFENGVDAEFLNNVVEKINDEINSDGGFVYINKNGDGIATYDKPINQNPTKAIQIKGGSIRIANGKKTNGEWNWRTFGTGDGFVADEIITGMLKGGNVKWNLNDGTFLIGKNTENYLLYFDGSKLKFGTGSINSNSLSDELKMELKGEDGKDGKSFAPNLIEYGDFTRQEGFNKQHNGNFMSNEEPIYNTWLIEDVSKSKVVGTDEKYFETTDFGFSAKYITKKINKQKKYYFKFTSKGMGDIHVYLKHPNATSTTIPLKTANKLDMKSDDWKIFKGEFTVTYTPDYTSVTIFNISESIPFCIKNFIISEEPIPDDTDWVPATGKDMLGPKGDKGNPGPPGAPGTLAELPESLKQWSNNATEISGKYVYTPELFVGESSVTTSSKTGVYIGKNVRVNFNGYWTNLSGLIGLNEGKVYWMFTTDGRFVLGHKFGEQIQLGADGRAIIPTIKSNMIESGAINTDILTPGTNERIVLERGYTAGSNNCKQIDTNYDGVRLKADADTYINVRKSNRIDFYADGFAAAIYRDSWYEKHPAGSTSNSGSYRLEASNALITAGWVKTVAMSPLSDISLKENVKYLDSDFVYRENKKHEIEHLNIDDIMNFVKNARIATYDYKDFGIDSISVVAQNLLKFEKVEKYLVNKYGGKYGVNIYSYMSMLHVALQEEIKRNDNIESEINLLKDENVKLNKKIDDLEKKLSKALKLLEK